MTTINSMNKGSAPPTPEPLSTEQKQACAEALKSIKGVIEKLEKQAGEGSQFPQIAWPLKSARECSHALKAACKS